MDLWYRYGDAAVNGETHGIGKMKLESRLHHELPEHFGGHRDASYGLQPIRLLERDAGADAQAQ